MYYLSCIHQANDQVLEVPRGTGKFDGLQKRNSVKMDSIDESLWILLKPFLALAFSQYFLLFE